MKHLILFLILITSTNYGTAQCDAECSSLVTAFGEDVGTIGIASSFFGYEAGALNSSAGTSNSFFGYRAGTANNNGAGNSFFGTQSGDSNTSGINNTMVGLGSGSANTSGDRNIFIGKSAGEKNIIGDENTFIGTNSGENMKGDNNTFLGFKSGENITFGSNNIAIGSSAGPIAEGPKYQTLYIDIKQTDKPLISGVFGGSGFDPIIVVNGEFEATGGVASSSDINVKDNIVEIDEADILHKVSQLNISEWSYKTNLDVRHIGPMAQDFRAAFGLGSNDTTISTLDTDGVALASIQALYNQLQLEQKENKVMKEMIKDLTERMEALEIDK